MHADLETVSAEPAPIAPAWGAVLSLALGVFGLVTAEFLPASLLTPMAASLGVSEGLAGQAVTATSAVAMVTSLLISSATRRVDRRWVLIAFSVLLIVSNLTVAHAPGLTAVLVGRVLLGMALGGFWSMAAAIAMRLVPEALIPRALSIMFSGVSLATIAAAPLGSYFGHLLGWRQVFMLATWLSVAVLVWQWVALPRMPPRSSASLGSLLGVMRRPGMAGGMIACLLVFTGHFAFFTYLRPFLENVTGVGVNALSGILLAFGVANFVGTSLAGLALERNLRATLLAMPLLMALIGIGLLLGHASITHTVLVALWGMAFGAVPVAWTTWITRTVPDEAESGGGLIVAAVQLAITLGAAAGGAVYDRGGAPAVVAASAAALVAAVFIIVTGVRLRPASDVAIETRRE
ncbi:MFS transporter [Dyella sp.]|uniref:MFS transporter n=1 Tax=Dyella sp. TaxID=1869338 RepID=UPI002ED01A5F